MQIFFIVYSSNMAAANTLYWTWACIIFNRCTAERALVSRMLPSRQYFRELVNENEGDAKFTRGDFKNKLRVHYFIHYDSFLIYWEFTGHA